MGIMAVSPELCSNGCSCSGFIDSCATIPFARGLLGADHDMGTVLGAAVGAIVTGFFGPNMLIFGVSVFVLGLLSAAANSNRNAFRFASVTLAVVQLVPRVGPPWRIALHRFAEVCIGLVVALILSVVWPEQEEVR